MVSKEQWVEIIKDFQEKELPKIIPRDIQIPLEIPINRAITIIGPRRAGKTYVMYQVILELLKKVKKEQILYVNLEKSGLGVATSKDLYLLLETFYELYPQNKKINIYFFLDEIHTVENWEGFVRTCLDDGLKVYLSGSSSKMLSKEIATSMRGRSLSYSVYPFSFKEFLKAKNIPISNLSSSEKALVMNSFREYFTYGGYPETVIFSQEREKILEEILEVTIYRDVIERTKIRNTKALKILIDALINSKEFSIHKFYNYLKTLGIKISKNTLYQYIEALNDAFFVFMLRKFAYSYKKAEQSIPKPYIIDNGFYLTKGTENKSLLMENLIFVELLRRKEDTAYYSYQSGEVDFLTKKAKKVTCLIQACYDTTDYTTKERETKALIHASKEFKCNNLQIITWNEEKEEIIENKKIEYIPLWKWLLSK